MHMIFIFLELVFPTHNILSSSIHFHADFMISFLFNSGVILHCINVIHFPYALFCGGEHLWFFHLLAIMNKATMNIVEQMSLGWDWVSLVYICPRLIKLDLGIEQFQTVLGSTTMISIMAVQVYTYTHNLWLSHLFHIFPSISCHVFYWP